MSIINVTKDNFKEVVVESDIPVLIDFWAEWCPPCKMLSPVIDEVAEELDGKVKVCKVNTDESKELAEQFRVMSIPMLVVLDKGKTIKTSVGFKSKNAVMEMFDL